MHIFQVGIIFMGIKRTLKIRNLFFYPKLIYIIFRTSK